MNRKLLLAFVIAGALTAISGPGARAAELTVQARVVDVQPLRSAAEVEERCAPRPHNGASLGGMLAWDLGLNCEQHTTGGGAITGYRVSYEWDNRIMSRVVAEAPGASIPVHIRLN